MVLIIAGNMFQVAMRNRRLPLFVVFVLVVPLLAGLLQPSARFYENGIALPLWPSRFLRWDEIGSYQWNGRALTLKQSFSMFSVGGIMHGRAIIVPVERQPEVNRILQTKIEAE
jgi:hypothetical protein